MKLIRKISILVFLMTVCVSLGGCSKEKSKQKVYRVGILSGLEALSGIADSFKAKMAELGYIEGKNITYDMYKTTFEPDKEQQILKKFIDDKVDLIFTFPDEVSIVAKAATNGKGIPVVFAFTTLECNNLVDSVRQPGGNITGVRELGPDVFVKRLEILHELAPQAKRVYITYSPNSPTIRIAVDALHKAAPLMNIALVENSTTTVEGIEADLQARNKSADIGIDAILIMAERLSVSPPALKAMTMFAAEHNIPIGGVGIHTIRGNENIIFSYEIMLNDVGRLSAFLADKIFKGLPAGTIPVVTPEPYLMINYKVAKQLGLKAPEGLLSRADEIIR